MPQYQPTDPIPSVHSRKLATSSAWSGGGLPGVDGNLLYYGDNLDVLRRHIKDESVDLVDLDPPFNSNTSYNVLFAEHGTRSPAQIH